MGLTKRQKFDLWATAGEALDSEGGLPYTGLPDKVVLFIFPSCRCLAFYKRSKDFGSP